MCVGPCSHKILMSFDEELGWSSKYLMLDTGSTSQHFLPYLINIETSDYFVNGHVQVVQQIDNLSSERKEQRRSVTTIR